MPDPNIIEQSTRTISFGQQREIVQRIYEHQVWCPDAADCPVCRLLHGVLGYYPRAYDRWSGVKRDA